MRQEQDGAMKRSLGDDLSWLLPSVGHSTHDKTLCFCPFALKSQVSVSLSSPVLQHRTPGLVHFFQSPG
jgi:hypothetical protein